MVFVCNATHAAIIANGYAAPIGAVAAYMCFILLAPPLMRRFRIQPMELKAIFCAWNLGLSLFSFWGLSVLGPHVLHNIEKNGIHYVLCDDRFIYGDPTKSPEENYALGATCYGPAGIASFAFMFSKFPELFDTVFLVLKGKTVIALQWWHHATVLLYCWHAVVGSTPSAVIFAVLNYAVHSVMYLYFGLSQYTRALGWAKRPITLFQIAQMVWGVAGVALCLIYERTSTCSEVYTQGNHYALCGGMYASYLVLFARFYAKTYRKRKLA